MAGRYGGPLRVAHRLTSRAQLAAVATHDALRHRAPSPAERAEVARRVTFAVKTFERPTVAARLVGSARRVFDGRIVVADDSRTTWQPRLAGVEVLAMPFNSGVSVGRNAALDAVDTEFVVVTDDDIVFTRGTDLRRPMRFLDAHPEVDLVGIVRIELPRWYWLDHGPDALFPGHQPPLRPWGELIGGLPVRLMIEQIYLARTESVRRVRWDERLRMVDHRDFFSRASGRLVVVLDPGVHALHARTPFDANYQAYRDDVRPDLEWLAKTWRG